MISETPKTPLVDGNPRDKTNAKIARLPCRSYHAMSCKHRDIREGKNVSRESHKKVGTRNRSVADAKEAV